jgi:hypothetical protein
MFVSTRIAANAVLLVASVGAGAAVAQQPAPQNATAPKPAASSAAAVVPAAPASTSPMAYRSAFDGYKGLTDQPVQSWRESNDTVGRIGGWQSYAREGQGGPVAGSAPPSETKGKANMPGMSEMPAGHGGMKMPSAGSGATPPMAPAASTPGPAKAPAKVPPSRAKAPAGSASAAMPADHSGHTKP